MISSTRNDLASRIENLSPAKRALLERRLREKSKGSFRPGRIPRRPGPGGHPLSFAQQRMWFLDQMEPGSAFYNVTRGISFRGTLNKDALERGIDEILRRHEALRTTFHVVDGNPVQVISPHAVLSVPLVDLRDGPERGRESRARQLATEEYVRPFDLSTGPLFRVMLLRLEDDHHVLLLTIHHIVSDGWSMGTFFRELAMLYEAFSCEKPSPLPDLPIQYADFAHWQRDWFQGEVLERQLSYWKRQLEGELPVLDLFTDRPRPQTQTYNGAIISSMVSRELSESLKALSRKEGATLFMTLLAAFQVLLFRYTRKEDILVGTPIANRNRTETEGLIGFFVNTLVMRTDLAGDPRFRDLLGRLRETALGAYAHQDLPFERLVEELQPERDLSRTPVFQVMFQLRNIPKSALRFPGLAVQDFDVPVPIAKFDISVDITEMDEGLSCVFEYNTDLFDGETISRMQSHFQALLEGVAADPDRSISTLSLLADPERRQLLEEWNETRTEFPDHRCVHHLFEDQVERTPDAPAVAYEGEELTYRELNDRANRLARHLAKHGVGPEVPVGICMERSLEMLVGILGVLKAGGAYVPLDPAHPKDRLAFMLEDTRAPVVLTQERLATVLPAHAAEVICTDSAREAVFREDGSNMHVGASSGNLAYVIYTSGSTGEPKGVMISHRALCNNMNWMQRTYRLSESDVHLQASSICFDASVSEIFSSLLSGGKLVLVRPSGQADTAYLARLMNEQKVTTLQLVPSLLKVLLEESGFRECRSLRRVICGGEVLSVDLKDRFLTILPAELFNSYGPTETTIDATVFLCREQGAKRTVPIGRPIDNVRAYVLDRNLQPVPVGVPGELCLGGAGLARGYLNRPDLTAEKFVPDPFGGEPGSRIYKTGDLVRYLADGTIEFLGRIDQQVKIRGYRIEPGEIEGVLRRHPAVRDAVVLVKGEGETGRRLVAYVVMNQASASPDAGAFRDFLKAKLPEYMVPAFFVMLPGFPLTRSGKVDRRALPDPATASVDHEGSFVAPRDELETHLKEIWQWVLGIRPIGIRDNFFHLGGHSLLAVKLFAHIGKFLGKTLPLSTLFHAPTIEELAKILREDGWSFKWSYAVPVQPNGSRPPFFCVHPHDGDAFRFWDLAVLLGQDQPFYGLRAKVVDGTRSFHRRIEDMATDYIKEIRTIQPQGPYFLGGHCFGGIVAVEMARQLLAEREPVSLVALIFSHAPGHPKMLPNGNFFLNAYRDIATKIDRFLTMIPLVDPSERISYVRELIKWNTVLMKRRIRSVAHALVPHHEHAYLLRQEESVLNLGEQLEAYTPGVYPGRLTLFRTEKEPLRYSRIPEWGWGDLAEDGVEVYEVPGYPQNYHFQPRLRILARQLRECIEKAQAAKQDAGNSA